jgi:hypothetical protein
MSKLRPIESEHVVRTEQTSGARPMNMLPNSFKKLIERQRAATEANLKRFVARADRGSLGMVTLHS